MADNQVRSVAIVLGDNDFGKTFYNLLESVYRSFIYHEKTLTRENITFLILKGIEFHYAAFQHRFDLEEKFGRRYSYGDCYLLSGLKILFDEEAEFDFQSNDHDVGAWYLCLQTGRVTGY